MRDLAARFWKVFHVIMRSKSSFSKLRLWITWLRLIANSIAHYKLTNAKSRPRREYILGLPVYFTPYASLIDLFEEIFVLQVYQVALDNTSPLIIDAGSNIGMSMLYFKKTYPNATILCFEPDPQSFELLKQNISANKLEHVIAHQLALSDVEGDVRLFRSPNSLNSGLYGSVDSTNQVVTSKKLSSFIDREIDLLKIDIEGAEDMVISELINSGKIDLIRRMIIEHHPNISHCTTDDFIAKIKARNFSTTVLKNSFHPDASEVLILAERL
jgi:FkbM family methyltransferase